MFDKKQLFSMVGAIACAVALSVLHLDPRFCSVIYNDCVKPSPVSG